MTGYRAGLKMFATIAAAALSFDLSGAALAQDAGGCFEPPAKLSAADVSSFLQKPDGLLQQFPTAGVVMASRVRALAGSSAATLDPIVGLLPQASSIQKSAIGSGLARAAKGCAPTKPDYALQIQEKVVLANSPELTTAFLSTSNDFQTASVGGTGAGPGAASIGGGGNAGNSGGKGGDHSVTNLSEEFSVGSTGSFSRTTNESFGTSQFTQR